MHQFHGKARKAAVASMKDTQQWQGSRSTASRLMQRLADSHTNYVVYVYEVGAGASAPVVLPVCLQASRCVVPLDWSRADRLGGGVSNQTDSQAIQTSCLYSII